MLDDISAEFFARHHEPASSARADRARPCCSNRWSALHKIDSGSIYYDDVEFNRLPFKEMKAIREKWA